ncbi:hypothetical protein J2X04_000909 [Lysobacter niabensis]|jgi:hypothetical protein|uniref:Lipoprotein n=1 Tax=Agrilutibacter niabensis TaxID=380628 RepID=A0ABU1VM47_9GAMM|nr:hypothetical protein [Lysobacter niabensis]
MKARIAAVPMFALLALAGAASAQTETEAPQVDTTTSADTTTSTLLIERVQEENKAAMPVRGQTMAEVEAKYGAPTEKLDPRGGQKHQWPTINRWMYPSFTVYFEKSRVIDVVANKADAEEIGPKPPIK